MVTHARVDMPRPIWGGSLAGYKKKLPLFKQTTHRLLAEVMVMLLFFQLVVTLLRVLLLLTLLPLIELLHLLLVFF